MPPHPKPRTFAPKTIIALTQTLEQDGVALAKILESTSLTESTLHLPDVRVPFSEIVTVFKNAMSLAVDPVTALRAGQNLRLTNYGMYGYALLSSPTTKERLAFAIKYQGAIGAATQFSIAKKDNVDIFRHDPLVSSDPCDDLSRFALEFTISAQQRLNQDLHGESFTLSQLNFSYAEPNHSAAYQKFFRCPVNFSQEANELYFGGDWKNRTPSMPDHTTHNAAREICRQFLEDSPHIGGIADVVRNILLEKQLSHFSGIESMAQELSLHSRTLRRKLDTEGTTYSQIVSDVKKFLAIKYLTKTYMSIDEIASRLGYSDATNFRHAFARWTGKTPNQYRNDQPIK